MPETATLYRCPKCLHPLHQEQNTLRCSNNHSYDIAREGYVNLILANQKKSLISGDSKEMIIARNSFLKTGSYDFLLNKTLEQLSLNIPTRSTPQILDVGCGSGYYINQIKQHQRDSHCWGSDVSKAAIISCSKQFSELNFVVGNSFDLPFIDNSFIAIISIFSPFRESEVARVLEENGVFILVRPGEKHLFELYEKLSIPSKQKRPPQFESISLEQTIHIAQTEQLDQAKLKDLITMTPLLWKIPLEVQSKLEIPEITYDFIIRVYRKTVIIKP